MLSRPSPKLDSQEIAFLLNLVYDERADLLAHVAAHDPYPADLLSVANTRLHTLDALASKLIALDTVRS